MASDPWPVVKVAFIVANVIGFVHFLNIAYYEGRPSLCLMFGHANHCFIRFNPERLTCPRCGWVELVHQHKDRNRGNGYRNTNGFVPPSEVSGVEE